MSKNFIRPLRRAQQPQIYVYDLETRGWSGDILIAAWAHLTEGPVYHSARKNGECALDLLAAMEASPPGSWWIAHNGGKFDTLHMAPVITARKRCRVTLQGARIIAMDVGESERKPEFVLCDSAAWLPFRLAELPKALNLGDIAKGDYPVSALRRGVTPAAIEYCRQDVEVLRAAMRAWIDALYTVADGAWVLRYTLAATATALWRTRYLETTVARDEDTDALFAREAYRGGAVIVGHTALHSGVQTADIHSSYPAALVAAPWPTERANCGWITHTPTADDIGLCRATVEWDSAQLFPTLPVIVDERMVFPTGEVSGMWTAVEVAFAAQCGAAIKRAEFLPYDTVDPKSIGIDAMMRELYARRKNSGAEGTSNKLLINSLGGKLAQRREAVRYHVAPPGELPPAGSYIVDVGNTILSGVPEERRGAIENPIVGAHMTARGRIAYFRGVHACAENGTFIYGDTDSISGTADLPALLDYGPGLGQWDRVGDDEYMRALGPKVYARRSRDGKYTVKARGISGANAHDILHARAPHSSKESGRGLESFTTAVKRYQEWKVTKKRKPREAYPKVLSREVMPDGSTRPPRL